MKKIVWLIRILIVESPIAKEIFLLRVFDPMCRDIDRRYKTN